MTPEQLQILIKNLEKVEENPETQDVFLGFLMEMTPVKPLLKKSPNPKFTSLKEAMISAEMEFINFSDRILKAARSTEEFYLELEKVSAEMVKNNVYVCAHTDRAASGECLNFGVYKDMADYINKNGSPLG